jgi:YggT family protein
VSFLFRFLGLLCEVYTLIIILRIIISWISPERSNVIWRILYQVTEPILSPLRRILPPMGVIDLSPLVAVVVLQLVAALFSYLS